MDIDLIFKIAAIGIIVSILNQVLSRSGRDEQATMTTLAGLVVVLMLVAQEIADLFTLVKEWGADAVIADRNFKKVLPGFTGTFIDFPHFAVSGRMLEM